MTSQHPIFPSVVNGTGKFSVDELSEQLKESVKAESERHSTITNKLDQIYSLMESLSRRQLNLEAKLEKLIDKKTAESSDATRLLDNLTARTSIIEAKISLMEEV